MSALFQEMCKLLQIKWINSTTFNPKMQGKVERFHAGLNQTMSHYVNKYGNDWDDYVNYVLMVHRATPHSITKFSPYYLLHGQDMRLPHMDDLSVQMETTEKEPGITDRVDSHIQALAGKLSEAYEVVDRLNKIRRAKQKAQYDKNTKLVTFSEGDYVYLKEMTVGVGKSKKFRNRWRGPSLITRRLSDLNYQIQIKPDKRVVVNINRFKRCHDPPKRKRDKKENVPTPKLVQSDDEWDRSDDEPLNLIGRRRLIPSSQVRARDDEDTGTTEENATTESMQNIAPRDDNEQSNKDRQVETIGIPSTSEQDVTDRPNEQTDSVGEKGSRTDQGQPYPYFLRPLPGRRNYSSADNTNE